MLSEESLEALRGKYKKIARVTWEGHELVFRRPTRDEWHAYLRAKGSAMETHTAQEHHSQVTIVAYDGQLDILSARTGYTNELLEECPGFANAPELGAALSVLAGTAQQEEIKNLGEVVRVFSASQPATRTASPNGSGTAPTTGQVSSSHGTAAPPQS